MSWLTWTAAALLAGAWVVSRLRIVCAVAAGYKSKVLCTARFASGREMDPQCDPQIHDDSYWILRPFRASVDARGKRVTTSLFGMVPRTAVFRDGLGATLLTAASVPVSLGAAPAVRRGTTADGWRVTSGSRDLQKLVDEAFEEPDARRRRRTHAVVIIQDGVIVAERYAPGITGDMPLPGWSMAKSVMGTLIGILVADGRTTPDTRGVLPQWQPTDPRSAISIEDLLRMRSGLRFSEQYALPWSDVLHMLYHCDDTAAFAASRPLVAAPGQVWQYASGTTNILSRVARHLVGEADYWQWPRRVLFDRLAMRSAMLETDASGTFVCSSYMLATARDWARFGELWLNRGRCGPDEVVTDEWVRFSTSPTPQSPEGRYGAHWWLALNPDVGGDSPEARAIAPDTFFAVGHEGQTITIMPSRRAVIVRLGASVYIDAWNQARFAAGVQQALS